MSTKYSFIQVVDFIFKNKQNYRVITDEDKNTNFFIINRKFASKNPMQAKFFNHRSIDKASALDVWYKNFLKTDGVPSWYWSSIAKAEEKESKDFTKKEMLLFRKYNEHFTENDFNYIFKYMQDEVKTELAILKKYED